MSSKDEQIQELREKLARAEGERDGLKEALKFQPLPVPLPFIQPFYGPPYHCAACGTWHWGGHICVRPYWSVLPQVWSNQTVATTPNTFTVSAGQGEQSVSMQYPDGYPDVVYALSSGS